MQPSQPNGEPSHALPAVIWLNVSFWIAFVFWTFILACIAIPYHRLYRLITGNHRRADRLIRRTIRNYGTAVIHSGWPLARVKYVDCAPDEKPPFIFVSNHRSASDAYLMSFIPLECVQVLNIWPSRVPLINYLSRTANYLRVREMPFESFLAEGSRLLSEGCSIIAFPEGTRSGSKKMGPFHGAAFRLAQHNGVKICPLAISGSENIPRRGSLVLHPGQIVMTKLPAITPEQYRDLTPYALKNRARDAIARHLEAKEYQSPQWEPQPA
jgi:1-acyl-sn-glycerol-3-phosphate acyltransferase